MQRRAVRAGQARADLEGDRGLLGRVGPHRDHGRPAERPHRHGRDRAAVHRHHLALVDVPHAQPGLLQGMFEGQRAADHEADEIVPPERRDLARFVDQHAVAPDAIARQVAAQVEILAERGQQRAARLGHADQRAGRRVGAAVGGEIVGPGGRQDHQVALRVARRGAAGIAVVAGAERQPRGAGRVERGRVGRGAQGAGVDRVHPGAILIRSSYGRHSSAASAVSRILSRARPPITSAPTIRKAGDIRLPVLPISAVAR